MGNKNKYRKVENFLLEHAIGISSKELAELVNREYGTEFTGKEMQQFKKARKIKGNSGIFVWWTTPVFPVYKIVEEM